MPRSRNTSLARELRRDQTPFERKLWQLLGAHRMGGIHWRRQHPIGPYIADFACARAKLIVELDGNSHDGREAEDATRDAVLAELGWRTLRIPNRDLMHDPEAVCQTIKLHLEYHPELTDAEQDTPQTKSDTSSSMSGPLSREAGEG